MMIDAERVIQQIERGIQVGKVFSFIRDDDTIWSSVGIQKRQGIYKVYVDEIYLSVHKDHPASLKVQIKNGLIFIMKMIKRIILE